MLNFNQKDDINHEEIEEMFTELVKKALTSKQSDFKFLTCWQDRIIAKEYIKGLFTTIEFFNNLINTSTKLYLEQIKTGTQDLGLILSIKQFHQCVQYYQKERAIAEDMLAEYRSYIWGGHVWDTLVGNIRKEEDMVDYRTLPIKWF